MTKILLNSRGFVIEVTFFHTIIYPKCCDATKNTQVINFYAKALACFPEKYFRGCRGFGFHRLNYFLSKF